MPPLADLTNRSLLPRASPVKAVDPRLTPAKAVNPRLTPAKVNVATSTRGRAKVADVSHPEMFTVNVRLDEGQPVPLASFNGQLENDPTVLSSGPMSRASSSSSFASLLVRSPRVK